MNIYQQLELENQERFKYKQFTDLLELDVIRRPLREPKDILLSTIGDETDSFEFIDTRDGKHKKTELAELIEAFNIFDNNKENINGQVHFLTELGDIYFQQIMAGHHYPNEKAIYNTITKCMQGWSTVAQEYIKTIDINETVKVITHRKYGMRHYNGKDHDSETKELRAMYRLILNNQ